MPPMENEQNITNQTADAASSDAAQPPAFKVVLASGSPRRRQLLSDAGIRFTVHAADVDETLEPETKTPPRPTIRILPRSRK